MTVSAGLFVDTNPTVISAGGANLVFNGLFLSNSTRVPIGTVASFASPAAVASFFGSSATEATEATVYFNGWTGSQQKPGAVLFAQYPSNAVGAYLQSGNITGVPLATLQTYSGTLTVVMDGYARVASSINLASATSYSNAASLIATGLNSAPTTDASFTASMGASFTGSAGSPATHLVVTSVTGFISPGDVVSGTGITVGTTIVSQISGTTGGAGTYLLSATNTASSASCTTTSNVMDVTAVASGTLAVGQTVVEGSLTGTPVITQQLTGTAGSTGTYLLNGAQQSVASSSSFSTQPTPVTVTYDSVSGAFFVTSGITGAPSTSAFATGTIAANLLLTAATGAVLSQGAAAATPSAFMNALVLVNQNWVNFTTLFNPDVSGDTNKLLFAAWVNGQNNRYCYVGWDTDPNAASQAPGTFTGFGAALQSAGYSGTAPVWEVSGEHLAAFTMGMGASIAFGTTGQRITTAYKGQTGLVAGVVDNGSFLNLAGNPQVSGSFGNGYNCYAAIATADANFTNYQRGTVSGPFTWLDAYWNAIWWTNAAQLALMDLFTTANSIPFNGVGAGMIRTALAPLIQSGLLFGMYSPGLALSGSQVAAVNASAGFNIADTLQNVGYYLLINPAPASIRASRGPWQVTFYYVDGGSIQSINLTTVGLQ